MMFSRDRVLEQLRSQLPRTDEGAIALAATHPNQILIGTRGVMSRALAQQILSTAGVFSFVGGGALSQENFVRLLPPGIDQPAFEPGPEFGADLLEIFRGRTWGNSQSRAGLAVGVFLVLAALVWGSCS